MWSLATKSLVVLHINYDVFESTVAIGFNLFFTCSHVNGRLRCVGFILEISWRAVFER